MEDNKTYRLPVDEVKASELDKEYYKMADLQMFLFPKTEKYGDAFWGTMYEINEKTGGCPWNIIFDVTVKYYKEWFGKKNVICYSDGKQNIIQAIEDGEIYIFDFWGSRIKGECIWEKDEKSTALETCTEELSRRLGITL